MIARLGTALRRRITKGGSANSSCRLIKYQIYEKPRPYSTHHHHLYRLTANGGLLAVCARYKVSNLLNGGSSRTVVRGGPLAVCAR